MHAFNVPQRHPYALVQTLNLLPRRALTSERRSRTPERFPKESVNARHKWNANAKEEHEAHRQMNHARERAD